MLTDLEKQKEKYINVILFSSRLYNSLTNKSESKLIQYEIVKQLYNSLLEIDEIKVRVLECTFIAPNPWINSDYEDSISDIQSIVLKMVLNSYQLAQCSTAIRPQTISFLLEGFNRLCSIFNFTNGKPFLE